MNLFILVLHLNIEHECMNVVYGVWKRVFIMSKLSIILTWKKYVEYEQHNRLYKVYVIKAHCCCWHLVLHIFYIDMYRKRNIHILPFTLQNIKIVFPIQILYVNRTVIHMITILFIQVCINIKLRLKIPLPAVALLPFR